MTSRNKGENPPPGECPYCGADTGSLPTHLPCDAVPDTDEVFEP